MVGRGLKKKRYKRCNFADLYVASFGKTRLLDFLNEYMMTYRLPDDQYYVDYENKMYQVLVSDEADVFIKTKDYSHLKHIFEGQWVDFNCKGKARR